MTPRSGNKPQLTPAEAIAHIPAGATVLIEGSGGGLLEPDSLIRAIAERHDLDPEFRDLELVFVSSIGDNFGGGLDLLAKPGLVRRAVGGMWGKNPALSALAMQGAFEAFAPPQGVMAQLCREVAAGRPGLFTQAGLGTYCDPRLQGARLNDVPGEPVVELMTIDGKEWLRYLPFSPDIALIRGSYVDERGNLSFESEPARLEALAVAQACHNSGGTVIAQAARVVKGGSLDPRQVTVPGILVDIIVEQPNQRQLIEYAFEPSLAGQLRTNHHDVRDELRGARRIIASRALAEINHGDVVNLGVGIADGVATLAAERHLLDTFTLTVEQGLIGGRPAGGLSFGASFNPEAIIDQPSQFDLYDGGGLDIAFLGFAQADAHGNVNVSRFNGRLFGPGGFINITTGTRRLVFCGTFTAGGLEIDFRDDSLAIIHEGKFPKFVPACEQITFSGALSRSRGTSVKFITERAVFEIDNDGLRLTEVAPGLDIEQDILNHLPFPVTIDGYRIMDSSHFAGEGNHGL